MNIFILVSCTTLDEYLIEDRFEFDQEIVIVGGSLPALFTAFELKKRKIPFRLFEGQSKLGHSLHYSVGREWGYYEFSEAETLLKNLVQELDIKIKKVSKSNWTFNENSAALVTELSEVILGLIPEKQVKLNHQLVALNKFGSSYQLIFDMKLPTGKTRQRSYLAKKVFLIMPFEQIEKISNLSEKQAKKQVMVRIILPVRDLIDKYSQNLKTISKTISKTKNQTDSFYNINLLNHEGLNLKNTESIQTQVKDDALYITLFIDHDSEYRKIDVLEKKLQIYFKNPICLSSDNTLDWGDIDIGFLALGFGQSEEIPYLNFLSSFEHQKTNNPASKVIFQPLLDQINENLKNFKFENPKKQL